MSKKRNGTKRQAMFNKTLHNKTNELTSKPMVALNTPEK